MRRVEGGDVASLAALDEGGEAAVDAALRAMRMHDIGAHAREARAKRKAVSEESDGPIERAIGIRATPSVSSGFSAAMRSSSSAPPLVESQISPTAWPAACCAVARSEMWRKIPPTGLRATWTMEAAAASS